MPNYLYLFRGGKASWMSSPQEMQEHMKKWGAWMAELSGKGAFKGGEPLAEGGKVVSGRAKKVTDGPYAESKDIVGGYLLVSAASLEVATELARGCPIFENDGSVEVRELREMNL
jgi:hypothetical protein